MNGAQKLKDTKKYKVYYGQYKEEILSGFDLLILEPKGQTKESILSLKEKGTKVIAYFSLIEIGDYDEQFKLLRQDDFISINGEPVRNQEYATLYMDIRKSNIKELLMERVDALFICGYDGIFIDTIGNLDYIDLPQNQKGQLLEAAAFCLKEMNEKNPNGIFIQNNGFIEVCDYTSPYLDGICFENPPCQTYANLKWSFSAFSKLKKINQTYQTKIFVLEENQEKKNLKTNIFKFFVKSYAQIKGYPYYSANPYYLTLQ